MTENFKRKASSIQSNDEAEDEEIYITGLLQRSKEDNCQLCLTGRAFNQLFKGKVQ